MKKTFISVLALGFVLAATAQSYKPAVKLEAGKKYEVVTTLDGNTTVEAMGQSMETPIKSTTNATLDIKAVADKGYQSSYVNTRLQFYYNSMGQETNYDSDKKEDGETPAGKALNNYVNVETTFTVDKKGNIIKETVVKPKQEKNDETNDMIMGMISSVMANNENVCPVFDLFVGKDEFKIGDSFVDSSSTNDKDGKSKTSTTYTLKEIKDGMAIFNLVGVSSNEKKMEQMGSEMTFNSNIKTTGEMLVDIATGLLNKKTLIADTNGSIDVQGMNIPLSGKATTTIIVTPK